MATNPKQTILPHGELPAALRRQGAICLDMEEGVVVLRASKTVHNRMDLLVRKSRSGKLTSAEKTELEQLEEIDDYLSLLNRLSRNVARSRKSEGVTAVL